jgi:hypothetical protein
VAKKKAKPSLKEGLKEDARLIGKGAVAGLVTVANLIPTGRAAKTVAKFASRSKATKLASGAPKVKTRTFTQGERARITNTPPKKSKAGPNSPIRGTKVEVKYKTREITPSQQATYTTGRTVRETTKKAGTYAKGAVTAAYVTNEAKNAKKKKDAPRNAKKAGM